MRELAFKGNIFVVVTQLLTLVSCSQVNNAKKNSRCPFMDEYICGALECVRENYPLIRFYNPQLVQNIPDFGEGFGALNFEETIEDTNISFQIHTYHDTTLCFVLNYLKLFEDSLYRHVLLIHSADTAYYAKQHKETNEEIFIRGEYHFRYMHSLFSKEESMYYRLYEDSLSQIRGDDLPPLPSLSEKEMERYKKLFGG